MAQQRILHLIEMPDHTPENPSLNESHIAKHNLIDAKGLSPTAEELKAEETRLLEEYASSQYARKRATEYPSLLELTVALYDTDDKSAVEAKRAEVKAKYPKPS